MSTPSDLLDEALLCARYRNALQAMANQEDLPQLLGIVAERQRTGSKRSDALLWVCDKVAKGVLP